MDSGSFSEGGGVGPGAGCTNAEERWLPPKTDKDEVPPNTELVAKGLGVDTRTENAFLGGSVSLSCWRVTRNADSPKTDGIC